MPDLQLRGNDLHVGILEIDVAEIDQLVASQTDLLSGLENGVLLRLEEVGADNTDGEQDKAQVYDIAAVTLAIAVDEHVQGDGIDFSVTMPHADAAPDFVEDGASGERANGKGYVCPDIAYTGQWEYSGTERGGKCRHAQVAPQ